MEFDGGKHVAVGDIDGNGEMDLVVTCMNAGDFFIAFGNDNGTFEDGIAIPLPGAHRPLVHDADGDGDLDVLVSSIAADGVGVFLNEGAGNWPDAILLPVDNPTYSVEAGDLDGDGAVDVATAFNTAMGGRVAVFFAQP
jgi:hypothetical protein